MRLKANSATAPTSTPTRYSLHHHLLYNIAVNTRKSLITSHYCIQSDEPSSESQQLLLVISKMVTLDVIAHVFHTEGHVCQFLAVAQWVKTPFFICTIQDYRIKCLGCISYVTVLGCQTILQISVDKRLSVNKRVFIKHNGWLGILTYWFTVTELMFQVPTILQITAGTAWDSEYV